MVIAMSVVESARVYCRVCKSPLGQGCNRRIHQEGLASRLPHVFGALHARLEEAPSNE